MNLVCYACHQPFTVTGWNPFRQQVACPQPCCGRAVHVGEAAERAHGTTVGKAVKSILDSLTRIKGREDHTYLADLSLLRIEALLAGTESLAVLKTKHEALKKLVRRIGPPTRVKPLGVCLEVR